MTRDELYSYLAEPKRLTAETLEPIRALYESYPYCAPFAFLYLYNLSLTGDVRYASELRRLSVLLPIGSNSSASSRGIALPSSQRRPMHLPKWMPSTLSITSSMVHAPQAKTSPSSSTMKGWGRVKTTLLARRQIHFPRRDSPSFSSHAPLP